MRASPPKPIITQGLAKMVTEDLIPCANARPGMNLRKNPVGEITAHTEWAQKMFEKLPWTGSNQR
jgi:hypothetical protein